MLNNLQPETLMWIVGGASSVVSGVSAWIATRMSVSTKLVEETFKTLQKRIEALESHTKDQAKEIGMLRDLIEKLRIREQDLLFKVEQLESSHADLPFPMWLKDLHGRMLYLNNKYEEIFLLPRGKKAREYIGKRDVDFWPKDIAELFAYRDAMVKMNRAPWHGIELVPNGSGDVEKWVIVKFPRYAAGKILIGIGGIAVPEEYHLDQDEPPIDFSLLPPNP